MDIRDAWADSKPSRVRHEGLKLVCSERKAGLLVVTKIIAEQGTMFRVVLYADVLASRHCRRINCGHQELPCARAAVIMVKRRNHLIWPDQPAISDARIQRIIIPSKSTLSVGG